MEKSCSLYSKIPGFRLTYGGKPSDHFTTFAIGNESKATTATYLNLELIEEEDHEDDCSSADFNNNKPNLRAKSKRSKGFGRIIFHTDIIDKLYSYMQYDEYVSKSIIFEKKSIIFEKKSIIFENKPTNAPWGEGERFFHIREPNGYQLSFAQPLL
jgi:hypothetical protein